MRISESRIRRIIREEARRALQEMPYAGNLGGGEHPDPERYGEFQGGRKNPRAAVKFAGSGRFRSLAEKHLANIDHPVWFAPVGGPGESLYFDSQDDEDESETSYYRLRVMDLVPDGIEKLERLGFESPARVGGGDTVILYGTTSADRATLGTPWMIFHAIFDSMGGAGWLVPDYGDPENEAAWELGDEVEILYDVVDLSSWLPALTMASARAGRIDQYKDALAEMMCQELLTSGGFRINDDAPVEPEYLEALHALEPHVKGWADDFRRNMRGKLIIVSVN
jgi:hypothetical protein